MGRDGVLRVSYSVRPRVEMPWLPEIGMELETAAGLDNLRWLGLGPLDAYPNEKSAPILGVYPARRSERQAPQLPALFTAGAQSQPGTLKSPNGQVAMIFTMPATIARRIRWLLPVLCAIATAPRVLHAQTATPRELRFDAASVRPNHTAACQGRWNFSASHGTVTAENAPLLRIVSRAYNLTDDRVSGPAWLDSECYDITAKAAGDVTDPT